MNTWTRADKIAVVVEALRRNNRSIALQSFTLKVERLNDEIDAAAEEAIETLYHFDGEIPKVRRALKYRATKDPK